MNGGTSSSRKLDIPCHVCGDIPAGLNHNGFSCVSCRFFFKRYASNPQLKLSCRKEGKCEIDMIGRKSCAKCRFEKCKSIGMKLTQKVGTSSSIENVIENKIQNEINDPAILEPYISLGTERYRRSHATSLSSRELELMDELEKASSIFEDERTLPIVGDVQTLQEGFNLPAFYSRRIVRFCKSISGFKTLNADDQLTILKLFYTEVLYIRFAFNFNLDKCGYSTLADEEGKSAVFLNLKHLGSTIRPFQKFVEKNYNMCKDLHIGMDNDPNIRNLIIVLFMFHARDNLVCIEFVRHQHFIYVRLLRRYLEHKYKNILKANQKYSTLQNLMQKFDQHQTNKSKVFAYIDCSKLSQILLEIYSTWNEKKEDDT